VNVIARELARARGVGGGLLRTQRKATAFLAVWLAVIGALTLLPVGSRRPPYELCVICGERGTADAIANVLLFLPVGFLLIRRFGRRAGFLGPAVLTVAIELAQHFLPGRNPSLGDLLSNTLGGVLGALAGSYGPWLAGAPRRAVRLGFGIAVALAIAGLTLTALLSRPAPPGALYYGQWTAELGDYDRYRGRVTAASVAGEPLSQGPLPGWERVRALIRAGAPVHFEAIAGPPPDSLAPVLSVYDEVQREVLFIGLDGADVVVRFRRLGDVIRFDRFSHRAIGLAAGIPVGDTLRFEVDPEPDGLLLRLNGRQAELGEPGLARGWQLMIGSTPFSPSAHPWLDALWLSALFAPAGFWSYSWRSALAAALLLGALLLVLPHVSWLTPTAPVAAIAALIAFSSGAAARALSRRSLAAPSRR
jgi:hypothetical protein